MNTWIMQWCPATKCGDVIAIYNLPDGERPSERVMKKLEELGIKLFPQKQENIHDMHHLETLAKGAVREWHGMTRGGKEWEPA